MTDFTLRKKVVPELAWTVPLTLLTPMVGGGAVARMVDEAQPVSGKTVRGQLRFWWRATRGGRYGKDGLAKMKSDEAWLFGKAATFDQADMEAGLGPSRVQVTVSTVKKGSVTEFDKRDAPAYVSFPLPANSRTGTPAARVLKELDFDVHLRVQNLSSPSKAAPLTLEEVKADIEAALWAWTVFGGVGARTRRGFGALARRDASGKLTPQHVEQGLQTHVLPGEAPAGVPQISRRQEDTVVLSGFRDARDAWTEAVTVYQDYRAYRRGTDREPGRSYWPEPDEIRRLTGDAAPQHAKPLTEVRKFPRAALGLPIIFHFRSDGPRRGEPRDTTLRGKDSDRLASPLLLRPAAGGLLIATVLKTGDHPDSPLNKLQLHGRHTFDVRHRLTPQEAQELRSKQPPGHQSSPQFSPDIPSTFLAFLKENLQ